MVRKPGESLWNQRIWRSANATRRSARPSCLRGGGDGYIISQVSGARLAGSWARSPCSSVVPVRGRPVTKIGRRISPERISGWRFASSIRRSRLESSRSRSWRAAMRPMRLRCASPSSEHTTRSKGSRHSTPPKSSRRVRRRASAASWAGSSLTRETPVLAMVRPPRFKTRAKVGRVAGAGIMRSLSRSQARPAAAPRTRHAPLRSARKSARVLPASAHACAWRSTARDTFRGECRAPPRGR